MGLIREPKHIDFTVLDKPWSEAERKEFSAFIQLRKKQTKQLTSKASLQKKQRNSTPPKKTLS